MKKVRNNCKTITYALTLVLAIVGTKALGAFGGCGWFSQTMDSRENTIECIMTASIPGSITVFDCSGECFVEEAAGMTDCAEHDPYKPDRCVYSEDLYVEWDATRTDGDCVYPPPGPEGTPGIHDACVCEPDPNTQVNTSVLIPEVYATANDPDCVLVLAMLR